MSRTLILAALLVLLAGGPDCRAQSPGGRAVGGLLPPGQEEPIGECEVIARVNGLPVTACEVMWQVNLQLQDKLDQVPPDQRPQIRRALLRRHLYGMLDMKMLYGDFLRKAGDTADLTAIHQNLSKPFEEDEVPKLMKRVDVDDRRELPRRLVEIGTSLRDQREDFFQRQIARSWIGDQIDANREVTHAQLLEYYQEHATDFDYPTQAKWEELMVRFDRFGSQREAYAALCRMGNEAHQAAATLTDPSQPAFGATAKAKSQGFTAEEGGQHDWTTQGALAAQSIDQALFSQPVGQMSPRPIRSDRGFHIVRVLQRKLAGRTPFTEVQQDIRKKIIDERLQAAYSEQLDRMRRESTIWTIFDGDLDSEEYATARSPKGATRR